MPRAKTQAALANWEAARVQGFRFIGFFGVGGFGFPIVVALVLKKGSARMLVSVAKTNSLTGSRAFQGLSLSTLNP